VAGMDLTLALKFLHVIGAAILFGTGLGIAFFLFRAGHKEEPVAIAATLGPWSSPITSSPPPPLFSSRSPDQDARSCREGGGGQRGDIADPLQSSRAPLVLAGLAGLFCRRSAFSG
jgi:predicted integral membrane protein DUF2269